MHTKSRGFTIVELLIVIVVIGILAAIVIVAFNGIQGRAKAAGIKSDLKNMAKQLDAAKATSLTNTYPTTPTTAHGLKVTRNLYDVSQNNIYYCLNSTTDEFAIGVRTKNDGNNGHIITSKGEFFTSTNLYASETCGKVGATWTNANNMGYDSATSTWAPWLN